MRFFKLKIFAAAIFWLTAFVIDAKAALPPSVVDGLRHVGAVYFYAQPGTLEITLWKRNLSGNPTERALTAILAGPDGTIFDRIQLVAPASKMSQRVEGALQAKVLRTGVYMLLLSANSDPYLSAQTIGFSTNAVQYMISSGAGHTDVARQEPIILDGTNQIFSIFFKPPQGAFKVRLSGLPRDEKPIAMYDATGKFVHKFESANGNATTNFAATDGSRDGVWELRMSSQKGSVLIEGVNFGWNKTAKPLPVWTTSRDHYFDLSETQWLLSPRRYARKTQAGEKGAISFTVFNNSRAPMPLELQLDMPPELTEMNIPETRLELAPGASKNVDVHYALPATLPDGNYDFTLVAKNTRTGQQAFSLGELRVSQTHQGNPAIALPIQLKLFEHDQFQFAYEPDFSRLNQFYFDSNNRPWQVTGLGLQTLIGNEWKTVVLPALAAGSAEDAKYISSTIGTDRTGNVYTVINRRHANYLLRADTTTLQGELVSLPAGGSYTIETFMGGKTSDYPPVVLRYLEQKNEAKITFWSRDHHLEAFIPKFVNGKLQVSEPILISDHCVGFSDHSGISNPVAADGDKLHFIWGETSDPKKKNPGVPTYTSTYNRKTATLSKPILLAYAPPVNDIHNMSTILVDSVGDRHVIVGSHGRPFQYLQAAAGSDVWNKPEPISVLGQTYVGATLDPQDGIHLFCRTWRRGEEFPGVMDAALYYQHKPKNAVWEKAKPFAIAALPGYSIFYHRITIDHKGRLYLSFDYWSTWSPYRESYPNAAKRPLYFMSADNGKTWKTMTTSE